MQSSIQQYSNGKWSPTTTDQVHSPEIPPQLVICFSSKDILKEEHIYENIKTQFPEAQIATCSTAGIIADDSVEEKKLIAVSIAFEKTSIQTAMINIKDFTSSYEAGSALLRQLPSEGLSYILVLSDGNIVNGSELVKGLNDAAPEGVLVTGGLAGDDHNFRSTMVGLNANPAEGNIIAIGLYGEYIKVTHGTQGGWESFGMEKMVTKSAGNKLYDLDNQNALELYKKYLGPEAENLPASALLFPLSVLIPGNEKPIVRTILSIDENENSLIFAGDIPENSKVRFMKANFDKIITASADAAQDALVKNNVKPDLALLVSCVGRKLILGQRTDEEIEAVKEIFGDDTTIAGFYSYGEISPFSEKESCQLHNQTMTITAFYEL